MSATRNEMPEEMPEEMRDRRGDRAARAAGDVPGGSDGASAVERGTPGSRFVSRGGEKLAAALVHFGIDVRDLHCMDLGSHVGGFVDCLLQAGAASVIAVEPGYGVLDYSLRRDPRIDVRERTNALHFVAPQRVALITIDVGWTPQHLILPAARESLASAGQIITLIKPQYEVPKSVLRDGVVPSAARAEILIELREECEADGWRIAGTMDSPIAGHGGNLEQLWLLRRADGAG